LFVGKDRFEKEKRFENELLKLEEEYVEYFKSRPQKFKGDEYDRLHNHYLLWGDNERLRFGFENNCELPNELMRKCLDAFNKIFKNEKEYI